MKCLYLLYIAINLRKIICMWAPSHRVIIILSSSVGNEIQEHEKPSFVVFPTAFSSTAASTFTLLI